MLTQEERTTLEGNILCLERGLCWDCHVPLREAQQGWLICDNKECSRQFRIMPEALHERAPVSPHMRGRVIPPGFFGGPSWVLSDEGRAFIDPAKEFLMPATAALYEWRLERKVY